MGFCLASRAVKPTGFVLPAVLWLLTAVAVAALALANVARSQSGVARSFWDEAAIEAQLEAGLLLTSALLQQAPEVRYREHHWQFDGNTVTVRVTPTTGLIDPNVASDTLLQALLERGATLPPSVAADYIKRRAEHRERWEDPDQFLAALQLPRKAHDTIRPVLGFDGQQMLDARATPPELLTLLTGNPQMPLLLQQMYAQGQDPVVNGMLDAALFAPLSSRNDAARYRLEARLVTPDHRLWQKVWWIDRAIRPDTSRPWTVERVEPLRVMGTVSDG